MTARRGACAGPAGGTGARRAARGPRAGERPRAGGAIDRRAVLARAALRRRRQPRGADPAPRAGSGARGPRAGADGVGRDDDPDSAGAACCARVDGQDGRGRCPASAGWRSRSPRAGPWCRCPRATATSGFLFARGATRRGRAVAARGARAACGSRSSRPPPTRSTPGGRRALAWAIRARPAGLDLRARPPAAARRLAGRRPAARRARGALPGPQRAAMGCGMRSTGPRPSASRCRCTPRCAWR